MSCHIFSAQYPIKGTTKALAVDLLRLNTLRCTKTVFLTPKRESCPEKVRRATPSFSYRIPRRVPPCSLLPDFLRPTSQRPFPQPCPQGLLLDDFQNGGGWLFPPFFRRSYPPGIFASVVRLRHFGTCARKQ